MKLEHVDLLCMPPFLSHIAHRQIKDRGANPEEEALRATVSAFETLGEALEPGLWRRDGHQFGGCFRDTPFA
ncbi:hypothetical protein, partial [Thalassospira sp.]|uniref:hypothetical protein n=1 Tax=Thalassospira sp. TaxID=1912094 RepID=UPI00257EE07A